MAAPPAEFPHWYYSSKEPAGRVFESQADLDAASGDGPWYPTPTAAADAAAHAQTPEAEADSPTPRSRR